MGAAVGLLLPDAGTACRAGESAREHQLRLRSERHGRAELYAGPALVRHAPGLPARDHLLPDASPVATLCGQWTAPSGRRWCHGSGLTIDGGNTARRFRTRCAASTISALPGNDRMQSRRAFLRTAAAALTLPFARISRSRAGQRTILNDASRLSPTPVAKHV